MRIISGKHKGKSIIAPKNLPVRPTTDFAKEALFNIIENNFYIDNLNVLDLFCGTGNISYEFASRGAKSITSVDQNYGCVGFTKKTAKELAFEQIHLVKNDVFKFLARQHQSYDFIFADPPYDLKNIEEIANLVFENKLLNDNGWLVIEHDRNTNFNNHNNFVEHRKYGNVNFSFLKNLPH